MNDFEQNKFSEVVSADNEEAEQLEMSEAKEIPQIDVPADGEETEPTATAEESGTPDGTEQLEIPMEESAKETDKEESANGIDTDELADGIFAEEPANEVPAEQPANEVPAAEPANGTSSFRTEEDAAFTAEYGEYLAKRKYNRTPLILALFGLMFSVFYGAGIVLGIIALVLGAIRYRVHKSEPLKWAIVLSIVCIALSLAFIFAVSGSALIAFIRQIEQEESQQGLIRAFARELFGR
ncbi:MAG: hypothetical protein MR437_01750 [Clostridiales bacterium]|nr:hypothetical protein [Clostridiales bacterium]